MLPGRRVARPPGPFDNIFVGTDGPNVDFSEFRHRPSLIWRGFRYLVHTETVGQRAFQVTTSGGVRIWRDAEEVACFEPFQRNRPQSTTITIDLPPGASELTLRLEDLHERDTSCFFALTLEEGAAFDCALPDDTDVQAIEEAAQVLQGLHTGEVRLRGSEESTAIELTVEVPEPFPRGNYLPPPVAQPPCIG